MLEFSSKQIILTWILSHIVTNGSERADLNIRTGILKKKHINKKLSNY